MIELLVLCLCPVQASCTDTQLRMDSLAAMRVALRRVEERSLFALLVKLADQWQKSQPTCV